MHRGLHSVLGKKIAKLQISLRGVLGKKIARLQSIDRSSWCVREEDSKVASSWCWGRRQRAVSLWCLGRRQRARVSNRRVIINK